MSHIENHLFSCMSQRHLSANQIAPVSPLAHPRGKNLFLGRKFYFFLKLEEKCENFGIPNLGQKFNFSVVRVSV